MQDDSISPFTKIIMVNLLQITIKAKYQWNISARLIKFGLTEYTILKRRIRPVLHQVKTLKFHHLYKN